MPTRALTLTLTVPLTVAWLAALAAACRPAPPSSALLDDAAASDTVSLAASQDGTRIVLRPVRDGVRLTDVKELAVLERKGRIAAPRAKEFETLAPAAAPAERLLFSIAVGVAEGRVCRSSASTGVGLKGTVALACGAAGATTTTTSNTAANIPASDPQVRELKDTCRDLAADRAVAEHDETRDYCTCLRRTSDRFLRYADYRGQRGRFRVECRNAATPQELRNLCAEIRDRACRNCRVEEQSCECPRGVTLNYASYTEDVERFHADCGG